MRVLLVQTSFLGDTILTTPLILGIKRLYPDCELWLMTTPQAKSLVENDPLLSGVIEFDKKGKERGVVALFKMAMKLRSYGFSRVYAVQRSYRTAILLLLAGISYRIGFSNAALSFLFHRKELRHQAEHDVLRNLALLGGEGDLEKDKLPIEERFSTEMRLFLPDSIYENKIVHDYSISAPYVVLVPGSAWNTKMWYWERYRDLASSLLERGFKVVVLGASLEIEVCTKVSQGLNIDNLSGKTTLLESMAIIKHACCVVCNDSMALHMASAFKVPNVSIFCATSPSFGFGPWRNQAEVIERQGLSCKPCRRHGSNVCPTGTEECMRGVTSQEVLTSLVRLVGVNRVIS